MQCVESRFVWAWVEELCLLLQKSFVNVELDVILSDEEVDWTGVSALDAGQSQQYCEA